MEVASEGSTTICSHCDRAIPSSNIDLHYAHCSRNLKKCKICGDMVPKKHAEEHFLNTHAPVACSLCSETMEREILAVHKGENCPQRIVTCEFCEFPLPAIDLAEHQEVCGNRTELCHMCNRYIRLRERYNHESRCTGLPDTTVGSSRDARDAERRQPQGPQRRQPQDISRKRLLFTIAVTGIAVLLGSFLFQKKAEDSQVFYVVSLLSFVNLSSNPMISDCRNMHEELESNMMVGHGKCVNGPDVNDKEWARWLGRPN
ncbi:XIAP-ASSOCIATED FACTOR 1-LIKE [Salix viminalis]|uniref:XIAP-ASSOCIATED FACTOR 1-LIKE n=1 Tax=Salix viminalis TaxID=40686 RepID=A0A9Q0UHR3_SALVM|nr:XIAP-ASSOCIATED FACTOR 1-LIKE [Salix viminalis]